MSTKSERSAPSGRRRRRRRRSHGSAVRGEQDVGLVDLDVVGRTKRLVANPRYSGSPSARGTAMSGPPPLGRDRCRRTRSDRRTHRTLAAPEVGLGRPHAHDDVVAEVSPHRVSSDSAKPGYPPSSFSAPRVPSPGVTSARCDRASVRASTPGASTARASSMNAGGSVSVAGPLGTGTTRAANTVVSAPAANPAAPRATLLADGRGRRAMERTARAGAPGAAAGPAPSAVSTIADKKHAPQPASHQPSWPSTRSPAGTRRRRRRLRARLAPCVGRCTRSRAARRGA